MFGFGNKYFLAGGSGTGLAGGGGAWTPADLSGLRLWLDSTDASTINTGTPINNDPVDNWNDKSGNSFNFLATTTKRPLYKSSGMGTQSKPYIDLDTTDDELASGIISTNSTGMVAFVAKYTTAEVANSIFQIVNTGSPTLKFVQFGFLSSNQVFIQSANGSGTIDRWVTTTTTLTANQDYVVKIWNNGSFNITINGVTQTLSKTISSTGNSEVWFDYFVYDKSQVGYLATTQYEAQLGSLIISDGAPSAADLTNVETYLNGAY